MTLIVDTHLLLWACFDSTKLPKQALPLLTGPGMLYFSAASIWEIGIKRALNKPDFPYDPAVTRTALIGAGYRELPISSSHSITAAALPSHHNDPFDRLLIGQAIEEGMFLLTCDHILATYQAPIRYLG
ncbi:type II toxin-antitoxin system VapC family toxin [Pseudomonas luteola]|uniref:type II toxin-antitoxin system VapC family toxin n=1 Tax=Pseudomonas luteola TaxID=47886 RepID=UPI00123A070D|nr:MULTISPECIES: type II toxin-antitoxin system VapC family toxin [Pseudomonas]MBA1246184.1 type II toxin-antitoxin system VapC family toxin [Pseudomonas zeshuii]QEU26892.1 type II toxin-antitoxin system VapC family toxin [Pseudomonas luteola]